MTDADAGALAGLPTRPERASRPDIDTPAGLSALRQEARRASDLLKALSHETRLTVLCLLSVREMSVSEIERLVALPQATLSQQLARLRLEGLVRTRRDGRLIYYRLADGEASALVGMLRTMFYLPAGEALGPASRDGGKAEPGDG